jgi:hypothetical protein
LLRGRASRNGGEHRERVAIDVRPSHSVSIHGGDIGSRTIAKSSNVLSDDTPGGLNGRKLFHADNLQV